MGIVATREDWSTRFLLLGARLVEALRCHVEVLDLQLLDPLSKHSIHLAHVDELVVDFVDASGVVALCDIRLLRLVTWSRRLITTRVRLGGHRISAQEPTVLSVAHLDL